MPGRVHPGLPAAASTRPGPPVIHPPGVPMRQPIHPGRFLARHYLEPLGLSQTETARRLGISRRRVNEIVMGHRGISADTAIRCALAFGWPASEWLALQAHWDSHLAWKALAGRWRQRAAGSAIPPTDATPDLPAPCQDDGDAPSRAHDDAVA